MCMGAGSNGWVAMHEAWSNGAYNNWANADSLYSMAYFTRKEIPTHFDIMDSFTILDMNHQSILGPTDPNRCMWMTGSVNSPGSPSNPSSDGGAMLDNTATPGESTPADIRKKIWQVFKIMNSRRTKSVALVC